MRVMLIRKADKNTEAGVMPSGQAQQDLLLAMGNYNERLIKAGVMQDGMGLKPSAEGVRLSFNKGETLLDTGPFNEPRELVAGFSLWQVESLEEAIEWARQWPQEDARTGELTLELRPVLELEDFEQGDGLRKHQELAERIRKQPLSITPHLQFSGNCRQAFEFYAESLGGDISDLVSWGDIPGEEDFSDEQKARVAHVSLNIGGLQLAGGDTLHDAAKMPGKIILGFASPEQTRNAFSALSPGGEVKMPPEPTFWSSCFAVVVDRFGVEWSLNCEQAPQQA